MLLNAFNPIITPILVAGGVALALALALVRTLHLHGHLSEASTLGVQHAHTNPTARVGGIAVVLGTLLGYGFADPAVRRLLGPLLLASAPAFAFGLLEDITQGVAVRVRLLATMGSGALGWFISGYAITEANMVGLDWLLGYTGFAVAFTAFAVGGIANAINIIDGFNGLAGGTVLIILAALGAMSAALGDVELLRVCAILAAAVLGFLLVNWPWGRIFLGDGGAYFAGFALAWLAVLLLARHEEVSAWAPMLACAYPMQEVLFSIVRRRKRRLSPGDPDRLHLHSLVQRRVVRPLLHRRWPRVSALVCNSATGALMWVAALVPALIAVRWPTQTPYLVTGFIGCAVFYAVLYARLTQFRWCLVPATLSPKLSQLNAPKYR